MPDYRRAVAPGGRFFFTLVTYGRQPFLCEERARSVFRESLSLCRQRHPFDIEAMALMPDHMHAIWRLPDNDTDFSTRFSLLKGAFTRRWLRTGGWEGPISASRRRNRRRGVWQRRFWEHAIRDERDFNNHLDYIHFNPAKHGLVCCPHLWPYSTFHRWVKQGRYAPDWGCRCTEHASPPLPDLSSLDHIAME